MATLDSDSSTGLPAPQLTRGRRAGLLSLGALLTVASLARTVAALLDARDSRRSPPGELVELPDGRMLHMRVAGREHAGPTVVLEAGQGLFSPAFAWLQTHLAEHATVVAYDRPGYGWSTPVDRPVDAEATAHDLYQALTSRSLERPYLLVGHSLGAFYVRTFGARYPEQTMGLVLLDPAHEDQLERLSAEAVAELEHAAGMFRWAARLAKLGVFRLNNPQQRAVGDLPDTAAKEIVAVAAAARYWQTAGAEVAAFDKLATAAPHQFGELPVMIIGAGRESPGRPRTREAMDDLHRDLASRSPRVAHHVIEDADHLTLLTVEEHARRVSELVAGLLLRTAEA